MRKLPILSLSLCLLWSFSLASANINRLSIKDGIGGAGSSGNPVEIDLNSFTGIAGLQFTIDYDSTLFSLDTVLATQRADSLTLTYNQPNPGHLSVAIYSPGPDSISPGVGPIVQIKFNVNAEASPQASPLTLRDVVLSNSQGQILDVATIDGIFAILGCNLLRMQDGYGPMGSSRNRTDVDLINWEPLSGVQFSLNFNPSVLSLDTLCTSPRTEGMDLYYHQTKPGTVQVLLFDPNGSLIPSDTGSIAQVLFSVSPNPTAESSVLELEGVVLTDSSGQIRENVSVDGTFLVEDFLRTPDIHPSTTEHSFGRIKVGSSGFWTLSITNQGEANLTISEFSTNNPTFTADFTSPQTIPPGKVLDLPVGFTPTEEGEANGTLSITSNDPDEAQVFVSLSGMGTVPRITADPASLEFGDVAVGNDSLLSFFILNTGWPDLEVYDINHSEPAFTISDTAGTIAGGDSACITVTFTPTEKIPYRDSLIISNNDRQIAIPLQGNGISSVKQSGEAILPRSYSLSQNYPNPFNATTLIRYQLSADRGQPSAITLKVYNIAGQLVRTLVDEKRAAGCYQVFWDGKDNLGKETSSGVYLYRLEVIGDGLKVSKTRKMILLK